jgi:hypothetical protein
MTKTTVIGDYVYTVRFYERDGRVLVDCDAHGSRLGDSFLTYRTSAETLEEANEVALIWIRETARLMRY